jgi:DNA-binding NarL/FixJ family response regulator
MIKYMKLFRKRRVVIIDDDPVLTFLMRNEVSKSGVEHIEVHDSAVPILTGDDLKGDLFFIDFKLPDVNGGRAARIIKDKLPKAVVVVISSSDRVLKVSKKKFGIDEILYKEVGVSYIVERGLRLLYWRVVLFRILFVLVLTSLFLVVVVLLR